MFKWTALALALAVACLYLLVLQQHFENGRYTVIGAGLGVVDSRTGRLYLRADDGWDEINPQAGTRVRHTAPAAASDGTTKPPIEFKFDDKSSAEKK